MRSTSSFGSGGTQTTEISGTDNILLNVTGIVIDSTGRIIVGATAYQPSSPQNPNSNDRDFVVACYTENGSGLDSSFNDGTAELINFPQSGQNVDGAETSIALEPGDKILLAGTTFVPEPGSSSAGSVATALVRLTAAGKLDPSFGELGQVATVLGPTLGSDPASVFVQPDGNVVVTGTGSSSIGGLDFSPLNHALRRSSPGRSGRRHDSCGLL